MVVATVLRVLPIPLLTVHQVCGHEAGVENVGSNTVGVCRREVQMCLRWLLGLNLRVADIKVEHGQYSF